MGIELKAPKGALYRLVQGYVQGGAGLPPMRRCSYCRGLFSARLDWRAGPEAGRAVLTLRAGQTVLEIERSRLDGLMEEKESFVHIPAKEELARCGIGSAESTDALPKGMCPEWRRTWE